MRILIITYYIAPLNKIGSIRWTKIAKYLVTKYNANVDIITMEKDFDRYDVEHSSEYVDETMIDDLKFFNNYVSLSYGKPVQILRDIYARLRSRTRRIPKTSNDLKSTQNSVSENRRKTMRQLLTKCNSAAYQSVLSTKSYLEGRDSIRKCKKYLKEIDEAYDVIISTYSPIWTHIVAKEYKRDKSNTIWIADFRDAYATDLLDSVEFSKRKRFASMHMALADAVFKVIDGMNLYLPEGQNEYVVPNGYDPDDATVAKRPAVFNFVYTGYLYGGKRDLSPLFRVLKELSASGEIERKDIRVDYAGNSGSLVMAMAKECDLEDIVVNHGFISRSDALELQSSSAILLMADWNTEHNRPCWSGKAYEYMMSKKPVIFIMSGDVPYSEPQKHIGKLGGVCYEEARSEETMEELKSFIKRQYAYWKSSGDIEYTGDAEYIDGFNYATIADKVWDIINELM